MRTEFEKALAEEFPFMRWVLSPIDGSYEAIGLDCGDGWYQLIRDMCREITAAYEAAGRPPDVVVDQVKEKFGALRFYYHHKNQPITFHAPDSLPDGHGPCVGPDGAELNQKVEEIVDRYEEMSGDVCEVCGAPGSLRTDLQWTSTLCDEHYQERAALHEL